MEEVVRIRPLNPADLAAVLSIQAACPEAAQWAGESYLPCASGSGAHLGWMAEDGSGPAGFLVLRVAAGEAELLNLGVAPGARRRGIGRGLVTRALEAALQRGARAVWLEVRESNRAAIEFYLRMGFARAGRRPGYYRDPQEAAVVLSRELPGGL